MAVPVEGQLSVGGFTAVTSARFTRPADTTAYAANDVVSNSDATTELLVFRNCVREPGGSGQLVSGIMFASTDAATNPNFDLLLFDTSAVTVAADNAASTVTDTEVLNLVASITFDGTNAANVSTAGANLIIGATAIGQGFKCAPGSVDLYGLVVARAAYTPASAENFNFKLAISQD